MQLGAAEDVAKEVAPDRILAYSSGASLDHVSPDLERVLDQTAASGDAGCSSDERESECITFKLNSRHVLRQSCNYEYSEHSRENHTGRLQTGITRVDVSLHVSKETTEEGRGRERHVSGSDSACIGVDIVDSDRLIDKQEGEARETNQAVVSRVALRALVVEVHDALLSESGGKEECVGDSKGPRG